MKQGLYVLILLLFSCKKPGDFNIHRKNNPDIIWSKTYGGVRGEFVESLCKTTDGGFVLAGTTTSDDFSMVPGKLSTNFLIIKVNDQGVPQWKKTFGGEAGDAANAVAPSTDGNFFIAGKTNSSFGQVTGFHAASNTDDAWVIKIDGDGNLLWQKTLGGFKNENANSVLSTRDGGCIIVGGTKSTDGDLVGMKEGLWIVKLSSQGTIQWQKTYGSNSRAEIAKSIVEAKDGNYLITGVAYDGGGDFSTSTYHGSNDVLVLKIDGVGNLLWQKLIGGSGMDWGQSVVVCKDGGSVIAGFTTSKDGDVTGLHYDRKVGLQDDMWIVKLDAVGNIVWQKTMGGINRDRGFSIMENALGHFVAIGFRNDDVYAVKLSVSGTIIWEKTFGGTGIDEGKGIAETSDGNLIFLGKTDSNDYDIDTNNGWFDYWLVKFKD